MKILQVSLYFFLMIVLSISYASASIPSSSALSSSKPVTLQYGSVPVLILSGTYKKMGKEYGQILQTQLHQALIILKQFYFEKGIGYEAMVKQANLLYNRFPANYQNFIKAEADGARLTIDEAKILNAMETLGELLADYEANKCAYIYIPPNKTKSGNALIGRNYDYPPPFDQLAKYLAVTILNHKGATPTAFISIAGEVYCPSCVNAKGVFMELNNGTFSGGSHVNTSSESLLARMLDTLQHANTLKQAENRMKSKPADYSLIINANDKQQAESFEYSTKLGMKYFLPENYMLFASTNYFLNPKWGMQVPIPTDDKTWFGVTRRKNLLNFESVTDAFDVYSLEQQMDRSIANGGALWAFTIYQVILDERDLSLYIKVISRGSDWMHVPLGQLFATTKV